MIMFGFAFGFVFRGPFLLTDEIIAASTSSSRVMTSMSRDPSFEVPMMRGKQSLSSRRRAEMKDSLPVSQQQPHANTRDETTSHFKESQATMHVKPAVDSTTSTVPASSMEIIDFEKQDKVVIAIKIHGVPYLTQLKQSLCLLTAAYNNRVQYDMLLFISEPLPEKDVQELQRIVHPARLLVEQDEKTTLQQHLEGLDAEQTARLLKRCYVDETSQLEWWTRCREEGYQGSDMPLRYNWQAEFRSKWIWYSKQLSNYRYMMWWDSDAMATKVWQQDPVAFMIRNKLKMFFDNFPAGTSRGPKIKEKIMQAYNNENLCQLHLVQGRLHPIFGNCTNPSINQIHGFFHITDLDFYRNEENLKWFDILIGNAKFSRQWDDQIAVTIPAAMRAANESWSMNHHGVQLDVYHNQQFDGQRRFRGGGYVKWYQQRSAIDFPESIATCKALVKNGG
jgi:hypothetical protein